MAEEDIMLTATDDRFEGEQEYNGLKYKYAKTGYVTCVGPNDYAEETLTIPSTVTIGNTNYSVYQIEKMAFKNNKTIKTLIIEDGLDAILLEGFFGCTNLTSVTLPSNLRAMA